MKYLLIPLLVILALSKVTLQSGFSKKHNKGLSDNVFYNFLMFATVAVIFSFFLINGCATATTIFHGVIMGLLSICYQVFYICAFSKGKISLTIIINNFSMLIPLFASYFLFDEKFGTLKAIATVLVLVSFVLSAAKDNESTSSDVSKKNNYMWLIFVILLFLSNGLIATNQKIYAKTSDNFQVFQLVAVAYITAAVLSFFRYLFVSRNEEKSAKRKQPAVLISGCVIGVLLGTFQCLNTYSASVIEGPVLYASYNGMLSILSALMGRILYKEKLSVKQCLGVIIGTIAIVLLCL